MVLQTAQMGSDAVSLVVGLLVGLSIAGLDTSHPTFHFVMSGQPIFLASVAYAGGYDRKTLVGYGATLAAVSRGTLYAAGLLLLLLFALKETGSISRIALTLTFAVGYVLALGGRFGLAWRNRRRTGLQIERTLLIADGRDAAVRKNFNHLRVENFDISAARDDPALLDVIGHTVRSMDRVIVACSPAKRDAWAALLRSFDVQGELIDAGATRLGAIGTGDAGGKERTLVVSAHPLLMRHRLTKRLLDIAVAAAALLVLSPVMLLVALMILIEDGRPILFVQRRVGQGNRSFSIYKFRSMAAASSDHAATRLTSRGDRRVTRVGRFIRASSLDELPQLWNVMLGQMSVVGPRPHAPLATAGGKTYWQVDERYWERHKLKPGLTGLAQVRGFRGATDHEDHLRDRLGADLEYLLDWTIWRDIRIIAVTIGVLVHPRAY